ncbi:MAG: hypothetical protein K5978_04315 [Campylobacter sp.]|nr:hypothetical protein [Campylobacter sp.]
MISKISRIQKLANAKTSPIELNTSLPVSIKVSEKIGYNRYMLKFHNRSLSTKSRNPLRVGANYWGEVESSGDGILIKNLHEKPEFSETKFLSDGVNLIQRLIDESEISWLNEHIKQNLLYPKSQIEFEIYTTMLLALQKNIIHIPFVYNGNFGLFQMKDAREIYLLFSNFAPIYFELKDGDIKRILTAFKKVAIALSAEFNCEISLAEIKPFWLMQNKILDIKG